MATSTYMTFLMHKKSDNEYEKLVDITEFPDLGSDPEMLETTTLSFSANYDHTDYLALKALAGKTEGYAVWFGGTEGTDGKVTPSGEDGKFSFDGQLSAHVTGGSANEVRGMAITIAPSTPIVEA